MFLTCILCFVDTSFSREEFVSFSFRGLAWLPRRTLFLLFVHTYISFGTITTQHFVDTLVFKSHFVFCTGNRFSNCRLMLETPFDMTTEDFSSFIYITTNKWKSGNHLYLYLSIHIYCSIQNAVSFIFIRVS